MNKRKGRHQIAVGVATLLSLLTALPGDAKAEATVSIGNRAIFAIMAPAGGLEASERSVIMQRNLNNALIALAGKPADVEVLEVRGMHVVTIGGYYIGSVDKASAKAMGLSEAEAARTWAGALRDAVADRGLVQDFVYSLTDGVNTFSATIPPNQEQKSHIVRMPSGLQLPIELTKAIVAEEASAGDVIQAAVSRDVDLKTGEVIPKGTVVLGEVLPLALTRPDGAHLSATFNQLRLKSGDSIPVSTDIVGGITDDQRASAYSANAELSHSRILLNTDTKVQFPVGQNLILELNAPAQVAVSGSVL